MSELLRKMAIITGPTSGIGRAFAYKLASQGFQLLLIARREHIMQQMAKELTNKYDIEVDYLVADLSKEEDITKIAHHLSTLKKVDLLVNNAGFGCAGYFMEVPIEEQMQMLNVHLASTVRLSRAVIPLMHHQKDAAIINVASFAAFMDLPGSVMYSTSKAAIIKFTQSLKNELIGKGIHIQALCPGFTRTDFHSSIKREARFVSSIPSFLWTEVDEVVSASLKRLKRNKVLCIPGLVNKTLYVLNKYTFLSSVFVKVAANRQKKLANTSEKKSVKEKPIGRRIASY